MDFLVVHRFTEGLPGMNYSHSLSSELLYLEHLNICIYQHYFYVSIVAVVFLLQLLTLTFFHDKLTCNCFSDCQVYL